MCAQLRVRWWECVRLCTSELNGSGPPQFLFHPNWRNGLSLNLGFTVSARLAEQQASGILPSQPQQCWSYQCALEHGTFYWSAGGLNSGPHPHTASTSPLAQLCGP